MTEEKNYVDKTLKCADCGKEFVWTAGEQAFYAEKGLQEPKHCKDCKKARKEARKVHLAYQNTTEESE